MAVRTILLNDLTPDDLAAGWDGVVVIDVIRAFTVAPWLLRQGAERLYLAPNAEAAVAAKAARFPEAMLLKDSTPDPRFDFPNSPARIAEVDLRGKTIIQATTNGTRGTHAVSGAGDIFCASFANAGATIRALADCERVLIVPTEGDEDVALADYLSVALTTGEVPDPRPYLDRVEHSEAGRICRERGADENDLRVYPGDLERCLELDAFDHALRIEPDGDLQRVEIC